MFVWAPVRGCFLQEEGLRRGALGLSLPMANFLKAFLILRGEGALLGLCLHVPWCLRLDLGVSGRLGCDSEGSCVLLPAWEPGAGAGEGEPWAVVGSGEGEC